MATALGLPKKAMASPIIKTLHITFCITLSKHYSLQYALQYSLHYALQYALHYALHYVLHNTLHYVLHYTLHYECQPLMTIMSSITHYATLRHFSPHYTLKH